MNEVPDAGWSATTSEIRNALSNILRSEAFSRSPKISSLLGYLVEKQIAGNDDGLREVAIATSVFNQQGDFNPRNNPIVRVNASRLRNLLRLYYAGPGSEDEVRIMLPDVGYGPEFLTAAASKAGAAAPQNAAPEQRVTPQPATLTAATEEGLTGGGGLRKTLGMGSSVGFVLANFLLACAFAVVVNLATTSRDAAPTQVTQERIETDGGTLLIMMCKADNTTDRNPNAKRPVYVAMQDEELSCWPIHVQKPDLPRGPA